jgi:hypothetical protein
LEAEQIPIEEQRQSLRLKMAKVEGSLQRLTCQPTDLQKLGVVIDLGGRFLDAWGVTSPVEWRGIALGFRRLASSESFDRL